MNIQRLLLLAILSMFVCSCASTRYAHKDWSDGAARQEARADTRTGAIKVYCDDYAGGRPFGIEAPQDWQLLQGLPRVSLPPPGGYCPIQALSYGTTYNREVLKFLAERSRVQQ